MFHVQIALSEGGFGIFTATAAEALAKFEEMEERGYVVTITDRDDRKLTQAELQNLAKA
jgi:hypothetical protein